MSGFLSLAEVRAIPQVAIRTTVIAGGAAGNHAVAGIAVGDALRAVLALDVAQDDHAAADIQGAAPADNHAHDLLVLAGGGGAPAEAFGASGAGALDLESVTGQVIPGGVPGSGGVQDDAHAYLAGVDVGHARVWAPQDLTAEFTITAPNTINNGGGTGTVGQVLLVVYEDLTS